MNICGIPYEVVESSEEECSELEGKYGYTDLDRKVIVIRKSDPIEVKKDTLIHEIGHAFIHETGLRAVFDLVLKDDVDREKFEEGLCSLYSSHTVRMIATSGKQISRYLARKR